MCAHTMLQSGVLAVHMRTVNLIDPESKWYTRVTIQTPFPLGTKLNYCYNVTYFI